MTPQQKIAERIYELLPNDEYETIRLADILLAINQYTDNGIYILDDGTFADRDDIVIGDYNLEKDNILDQSDEFCEFLLELLK